MSASTTTAKLSDVPTYGTSAISSPALISVDATTTSAWKILETVNVRLLGVAKDTDEPRKALTDWYTKNKATIATLGLEAALTVSSWAVVVDITWKAAFNNVRLINTIDDTKTPPTNLANSNFQAFGSTGDTIAVVLSVKSSTYTQPAVRVAQTVTTAGAVSPGSIT
jgi:hypothetical protein